MLCSECPFARNLNDRGRYVCQILDQVVKGHWSDSTDCQESIERSYNVVEETKVIPESTDEVVTIHNTQVALTEDSTVESNIISNQSICQEATTLKIMSEGFDCSLTATHTWAIFVGDESRYRIVYSSFNNLWMVTDSASINATYCLNLEECIAEIRYLEFRLNRTNKMLAGGF